MRPNSFIFIDKPSEATKLLAEARIEAWGEEIARKIAQEFGWNWHTTDSE